MIDFEPVNGSESPKGETHYPGTTVTANLSEQARIYATALGKNTSALQATPQAHDDVFIVGSNRVGKNVDETVKELGKSHITAIQGEMINRVRRSTEDLEEVTDRLQQTCGMLVKLHADLEKGEEKFKSEMDPRARRVQANKAHEFLLAVAKLVGDVDYEANEEAWRTMLKEGSPIVGKIPRTRKWSTKITKAKKMTQEILYEGRPEKERKKAPGFMAPEDIQKTWEGIEGEEAMEVSWDKITSPPAHVFAVRQGEVEIEPLTNRILFSKLRRILDYRDINEGSDVEDKLEFQSSPAINTILQLLMAERQQFQPINQAKKDVTISMGFRDNEEDEIGDKARKNWFQKGGQAVRRPAIGKKDFKGYYWQWACSQPQANIAAVFCPAQGKYRYYMFNNMQFGSLFAIYNCCRISELLNGAGMRLFLYPSIIYIDDTVIFCRSLDELRMVMASYGVLYALAGIETSDGKEETMAYNGEGLQRSMTILGLAYKWNPKGDAIFIGSNVNRLDKAGVYVDMALGECKSNGQPKLKTFEKVIGLARYIYQQSNDVDAYFAVTELNRLTVEKESMSIWYKAPPLRTGIVALLLKLKESLSATRRDVIEGVTDKLLEISARNCDAPVSIVTSDASLENGVAIMAGIIRPYKGLLSEEADRRGEEVAYSLKIDANQLMSARLWKQKGIRYSSKAGRIEPHIQMYETLALQIMQELRPQIFADRRMVASLDNVAAVYATVTGGSRCMVTGAIAANGSKKWKSGPLKTARYIKSLENEEADLLSREPEEFWRTFKGTRIGQDEVDKAFRKAKHDLESRLRAWAEYRVKAEEWLEPKGGTKREPQGGHSIDEKDKKRRKKKSNRGLSI